MAKHIDFYVLDSNNEQDRMIIVCKLVEKAHRLGHNVFVKTSDHNQSIEIDRLMWTFSQSSFIPHAIEDKSDSFNDQQPVLINHLDGDHDHEILLNLSPSIPANLNQYQRVIEVVNTDETVREISREKYRKYRQQNQQIKTTNL